MDLKFLIKEKKTVNLVSMVTEPEKKNLGIMRAAWGQQVSTRNMGGNNRKPRRKRKRRQVGSKQPHKDNNI